MQFKLKQILTVKHTAVLFALLFEKHTKNGLDFKLCST